MKHKNKMSKLNLIEWDVTIRTGTVVKFTDQEGNKIIGKIVKIKKKGNSYRYKIEV